MARRKEYRESVKEYDRNKSRMVERGEEHYGEFNKSKTAETHVEDWGLMKDAPMRQQSNGSMDYRRAKEEVDREDARKISSSILPQR